MKNENFLDNWLMENPDYSQEERELIVNAIEQFNNDEEYHNSIGCCVECNKQFIVDTDLILCDECKEKFDLDLIWKHHDENKIFVLDFNDNVKIRDKYRKDK